MILTGHFRIAVALAITAVLAGSSLALAQAQKSAPAKQSKQKAAPKQEAPKQTQAPPAPQAALGGAQPSLLGQFGDWGAYAATAGGRKVCYALAKPGSQQTNPAGRPRDPAYLMISTRPAENVRDEVSVVIGYPFKGDATAEVGPTKFAMYTQNDGAWIKNVAEEARMVDAMRKGADLVIKGVSGRGTQTTDTYSLKGLAQALDRIAQECR
jgi:Invasion associated locus B (IalB) protein